MADGLRVDRWLWFGRFFKSRSIASIVCATRKVRINGVAPAKANHLLRVGDVLTFPAGEVIRVVQVAALGTRRGPAAEALSLYEDLAPPPHQAPPLNPRSWPLPPAPPARDAPPRPSGGPWIGCAGACDPAPLNPYFVPGCRSAKGCDTPVP